jgi:hypothetical protein
LTNSISFWGPGIRLNILGIKQTIPGFKAQYITQNISPINRERDRSCNTIVTIVIIKFGKTPILLTYFMLFRINSNYY